MLRRSKQTASCARDWWARRAMERSSASGAGSPRRSRFRARRDDVSTPCHRWWATL